MPNILDWNKARDQYLQTGNVQPYNSVMQAFAQLPNNQAAIVPRAPVAPTAPTPPPSPVPDPSAAFAQQDYNNRINQIRSMFDQTKQRAADVRSQADKTFADLLAAVGAFRDRSKTQYNNAGQEIINRSSDILGSNARTAQEGEGKLRAQGRALGLGDSSKFLQQTGLAQKLASTQGNTLARRGEEDRANSALLQERVDQAQAQENEANRYKQSLYDQAGQLENMGLSQFGGDTANAANAFGSSLNNILNYQRQLAAINPLNAGGLSQYAPNFSGIKNTLGDILGGGVPGPTAAADPTDAFANPYAPTNIQDILKLARGTAQRRYA